MHAPSRHPVRMGVDDDPVMIARREDGTAQASHVTVNNSEVGNSTPARMRRGRRQAPLCTHDWGMRSLVLVVIFAT